MVDMVKKVVKADGKRHLLDDGEEVLAAGAVSAVGEFVKAIAYGAVAKINAHHTADRAAEPAAGTLASSWPSLKHGILVVTDQRLVLCEQSLRTFGPKSVHASWSRNVIRGIALHDGSASTIVNVVFVDGSVAQMESLVTAKPHLLVEALS